jgi:hypothetical protein
MSDAKAKPTGKSLADFRAAHDKSFIVPKKINEGLAALGDSWEYEPAFIKIAGLSVADCAAYREQFEEFIVVVGSKTKKRVWCGTKKLAAQLREMV